MSKEVGGMVGSRRVQGAESAQRATQPSGRLLAGGRSSSGQMMHERPRESALRVSAPGILDELTNPDQP